MLSNQSCYVKGKDDTLGFLHRLTAAEFLARNPSTSSRHAFDTFLVDAQIGLDVRSARTDDKVA
jgi:hypothetical protein